MDKEQFLNKWGWSTLKDINALIEHEIAKAKEQPTAMPIQPIHTEQPQPELCESDAIDYILTNKLNWKKLGDNRMFAIGFARTGASFRVSFVEYHHVLSGNREVIIHKIDLSEWQPVDTSIKQTAQNTKPFDRDRFEAMFRAVVANGDVESNKFFECTKDLINQLDAYYINQEKGGTNA